MEPKKYEGKDIKILFTDEEGNELGSGIVAIYPDGRLSTEQIEQEFYGMLRGNEKDWRKEFAEEYKEFIIDNLTDAQEDILKDKHMDGYTGCDDDAPDDYENWLMDLDLDDLKTMLKI